MIYPSRGGLPLVGIGRRFFSNRSIVPSNLTTLDDISSPHWSSEALVPIFVGQTQSVNRFIHAPERSEVTSYGTQFLKKPHGDALIRAANSVIGVTCEVRHGWFTSLASSGTAFEVGPGGLFSSSYADIVFLTHNHFPGEKKQGRLQGILPVYKNGRPVELSPEVIDACGHPDEVIRLDPISDPWYSKGITAYLVMLKTLQQARMEGIWKPAMSYLYKWGDTVYMTDRGSRTNMGHALDVGVLALAEFQDRQLNRKKYTLNNLC